jgi:hypothetical protein
MTRLVLTLLAAGYLLVGVGFAFTTINSRQFSKFGWVTKTVWFFMLMFLWFPIVLVLVGAWLTGD